MDALGKSNSAKESAQPQTLHKKLQTPRSESSLVLLRFTSFVLFRACRGVEGKGFQILGFRLESRVPSIEPGGGAVAVFGHPSCRAGHFLRGFGATV